MKTQLLKAVIDTINQGKYETRTHTKKNGGEGRV